MDRPLKDHISLLEQRIEELTLEAMQNNNTLSERNRIESEIRVAQMALSHYRQALELEKELTL